MIPLAFLISWLGYGAGYWGYSLVKGYNLSLSQLVSPVNYYTGVWPPAIAGNDTIIPGGNTASLANANSFNTSTAITDTGAAPAGISNSAAIQKAAAMFGWGSGPQWDALQKVVAIESGGNPKATNPTSGAFGIAQAYTHGNANTAGTLSNNYGGYGLSDAQARLANSGDAWWQSIWMMGYIKATYGNPQGALNSEYKNGSY
jgi:hypothetical protein